MTPIDGPDASSLDPSDWAHFRQVAHAALDDMISFVETVRERPVWTETPDVVRQTFEEGLPRTGQEFAAVLQEFDAHIKPYATGNLHPSFMGWVHGAGTPVGMIADMLAAGLNANCGGRNHVGIDVERQITQWMREAFSFPETATGVFVTGTSMANFLGLLIARTSALGDDVRARGLQHHPQLCAYTSAASHGCIAQAMELAGIGSNHLRRIACNAAGEMEVDALADAVAADRANGLIPFLVVATAGTVDTGAIDPLAQIGAFCRAARIWFHVDGAFGALAAMSDRLRPMLAGIDQADSIAFDFHKWAHVPYDAGFLLVRDGTIHRRTFASHNRYLTRATTGLAAGDTWPCDLGPDLSRNFRALKTWFTFKTFGADRLGAMMEKNCHLAQRLTAAITASPHFRLVAPVRLNIVCFSARCSHADDVNRRIVEDLHTSGQAAPSTTILDDIAVIRCAITNHRTEESDIDALLGALDVTFAKLALSTNVKLSSRAKINPM